MKWTLGILAMTLLLAGCGDGGKGKMDAVKICSQESMAQPMNKLSEFMIGCMKAKSFVFDAACQAPPIREEDPVCYKDQ